MRDWRTRPRYPRISAGTRLLVSEATHTQVADEVEVGKRVTVPIRGKSGEHTLFGIVGLAAGA